MSNMLRINKRTLFIVILLSFVIICFTSITVSAYFRGNDTKVSSEVSGNNTVEAKLYKSIKIEKGDILWSIAKNYCSLDYYKSIDEYIKEVKSINKLVEDNITAGNYLTVPYYDTINA